MDIIDDTLVALLFLETPLPNEWIRAVLASYMNTYLG